jgi:hypothetical protein
MKWPNINGGDGEIKCLQELPCYLKSMNKINILKEPWVKAERIQHNRCSYEFSESNTHNDGPNCKTNESHWMQPTKI